MQPLISVVVTIYNMEEYLEDCIKSIISQSFTDIEIVLINDGSTDNSRCICDKYSKLDARIKVFNYSNMGLTNARKEGIKKSTGEYIVFVDADDWIEEDTCKQYASIISKYEPDVIVDGLIKEYNSGSAVAENIIPVGVYSRSDIEKKIFPYMMYTGHYYEKGIESYICSKAVKRRIIMQVAESIKRDVNIAEGAVWLYSVLMISYSAVLINNNHYHYRMHNNSMAMESSDELKSLVNMYEILAKNISESGICKEGFFDQLDHLMMFFLIWKRLDLFNQNDESVVWPYLELKKTDRIVIYGAWRYGKRLYEYLTKRKFGKIVLVIDRNAKQCRINGLDVLQPEALLKTDYDYILLGSETYSVIKSMKDNLQSMGIADNILVVSEDRIDISMLPEDFKNIRAKYE